MSAHALRVALLLVALALARGEEDLYVTLGVPRDASARVIKKEYYRLARSWHPDKHKGDKKVEAKFKKISRAYEILSDPDKRRRYDQFGEEGLNENGGGGRPGGFHARTFHGGAGFGSDNTFHIDPEMFNNIFGGGFGGGQGGFGGGSFGGFGGGGFGGFQEEREEVRRPRVCMYNKVCSSRGCRQVKECKS